MTPKEYLQQAYRLDELIECDLKELDNLRELSTSIGSQDTSKDFVSTSPSGDAGFTKIVDKIVDLQKKINDEIDSYIALKDEIREVINSLSSNDEKLCLRLKYLSSLTWVQIAEQMNYSRRQTIRIHGEALMHIDNILKHGTKCP